MKTKLFFILMFAVLTLSSCEKSSDWIFHQEVTDTIKGVQLKPRVTDTLVESLTANEADQYVSERNYTNKPIVNGTQTSVCTKKIY